MLTITLKSQIQTMEKLDCTRQQSMLSYQSHIYDNEKLAVRTLVWTTDSRVGTH